MQMTVRNPLARIALQFLVYLSFALMASNLVVEANFNSKLNLVWILVSAAVITLVFKQGIASRIALATFLAMTGLVVLALTSTGELYWANWGKPL